MKRWIIALVLAILVGLALLAISNPKQVKGYGYGYAYPGETITCVTENQTVTITFENYTLPRSYLLKDFADQHELAVWMATAPWIFPDWTIPEFDCEDYAEAFQLIALRDGYLINCEKDTTAYDKGLADAPHFLNSCKVGDNELWFIEPQNHTYWFDCYLDPPVRD